MDINNIYFYLLLGVFFYFLFTYILENYLVEQENFDPSLVPVSSIVTLAKVAQKLVNGNGTLTNPGNLQIGKDVGATSGNLTVTGKTAIGSTTMGDKTLNVTGTVGVSGDTTVGGNTNVGGTMGITGNTTVGGTLGITGTTTLSGNTELSGLATPLLVKKGTASPDNTKIQFGDGTGWRLRFQKDDENPVMDIVDNKDVNVHGSLSVTAGNRNKGINITSGNPFISFNKTGGSVVPQLYSDGNVLRAYNADFRVEKNLIVDGTILNGHTYVATITPTSAKRSTKTNVWSGNPLVSGVDYLAEAHIYFVRQGSGFDGFTGYFCYGDGVQIGLPFASSFHNNIIDLGGGAGVPRSSAIAIIKGGTQLYFQMNNTADDDWTVSGYIIFKPCNLI